MSDIAAIYDMTTEFAADKLSLSTVKSTVGLTRWNKDAMISFFPVDIHGNRLKYESGIDIVYDLFLTKEQMESLIRDWNEQSADQPFVADKLIHD